jgi:hypothetical protein
MRELSRRIFLNCGFDAYSAGVLIRPLSARNPVTPYYKAVFDERFEDARALASQATALAVPRRKFAGTVTNLFFSDLDQRWKRGPVWLIRLTTPASLFCLHLLARDRGMRLCFYRTNPDWKAVQGLRDGALPLNRVRMPSESSASFDLVLWIIAPNTARLFDHLHLLGGMIAHTVAGGGGLCGSNAVYDQCGVSRSGNLPLFEMDLNLFKITNLVCSGSGVHEVSF